LRARPFHVNICGFDLHLHQVRQVAQRFSRLFTRKLGALIAAPRPPGCPPEFKARPPETA
jgi:hypothetical protein